MADNSAILKAGSKIAKNVITADVMRRLNNVMVNSMGDLDTKFNSIPGMTGNAKTSGAAAVYNSEGQIEDYIISGENNGRNYPIQKRLTGGQVFEAGQTRYDGDTQKKDFKANVATSNNFIQKDNWESLESRQGDKDMKIVMVAGTEYFSTYGWDSYVTDNYGAFEEQSKIQFNQ